MKTFVLISVVVAVALAAPTNHEEISGPKREKKSATYGPPATPSIYGPAPAPASSYGSAPSSSYGLAQPNSYGPAPSPSYGPAPSPSYGPAPLPSYGPAPTFSYGPAPSHGCGHAPTSPGAFYFSPAGHFPSPLHYRSEKEAESHPWKSKMLAAQENYGPARSYGAYGPVAGSLAGGAVQAEAAGPALGLFPKANIGGCAVPLLLSCAPSIIKGQLLNSQSASYSAPAPAPAPALAPAPAYSYRTNLNLDSDSEIQLNEDNMQKIPEQVQLSDMERAVQADGQNEVFSSDPQSNPATMIDQGLDQTLNHMHTLTPDAKFNLSENI